VNYPFLFSTIRIFYINFNNNIKMTKLTIEIPDKEVKEISTFVRQKGGKVVEKISVAAVKRSQLASLKQGLTEAILISRGEMEGTPLSQL